MTSWTVLIFSASSSEISMSYSSSRAMTNSTISRESAPRSSMNDASGVTSSSLTPNCSQMISFTFPSTGDAIRTPPSPLHVHPAVYADHLAGDIARFRADEKGHHVRHLLDRSQPADGDQPHILRPCRFRQASRHFGFDESGRDGIHGDVTASQLARH